MGAIASKVIGSYMYVSKISGNTPHEWALTHLLKSNYEALSSSQSFVQSLVVSGGFHSERRRVEKGGEYIGNDFRDYFLYMGVTPEYASTNTPQQSGIFERVGVALAAVVRWTLTHGGLPKYLWGALF